MKELTKTILSGIVVTVIGSLVVAFVVAAAGAFWQHWENLYDRVTKDYKENFVKIQKTQNDQKKFDLGWVTIKNPNQRKLINFRSTN